MQVQDEKMRLVWTITILLHYYKHWFLLAGDFHHWKVYTFEAILYGIASIEELVSDMDDKLFNCILSDKHHVLSQLLPPEPHCGDTLRPRKHELCLINKSRLDEQNFMYRLLFKDMYWPKLKWSEFYFLFYFIYLVKYRKNSNIMRTLFTKNRGLVVRVRIINVNYSFVVGFSHQIVIKLHYAW